jgi:imidazolonepropionase
LKKKGETMEADLLIDNIGELITLSGGNRPRTGKEMRDIGIIKNGAIAVKDDRIVAAGNASEVKKNTSLSDHCNVIDGKNKTVMPGFVDPHTHLVFAGTRENELELKLEGKTYLEILQMGGGILRTVNATRSAGKKDLFYQAVDTLNIMLSYGTTSIEAKSGYGLDTKTELKSLEVLKELNEYHAIDIVPTFLGAHAVPPEFKDNPDDFIDLLITDMLPKVAEKKLAKYCDVFCEKGVFSIEQSKKLLNSAKAHGLRPRLHADEIVQLGGAELACEVDAISADHLAMISDDGIRCMAEKGVIGILLPGTPFVLMQKEYPRAREMIEAGVPIALATDYNPNCWTESMQIIIALACYNMKMLPSEAIAASTINAACAIDMGNEVGSLEEGKKADIQILNVPNHMHIPYHFGINHVETVLKNGKIVVDRAR